MKCDYCGRENDDEATRCSGCNTVLIEETGPKRKSKSTAMTLAFVFGPFGFLYFGLEGFLRLVFLCCVFLGLRLILHVSFISGASVFFFFLDRIICLAWAAKMTDRYNNVVNPVELLEEAARLENSDKEQALAKYREIADIYPDSAAGREAKRNFDLLSAAETQGRAG